MTEEILITTVMALVGLLFVASISALVMKRLGVPYTVGLVLVGVGIAFLGERLPALGEALRPLVLGPAVIMFVFVPVLIFESAFSTDGRLLRKNLVPTLALAVPGLLISTFLIGGLVHLATDLPLGSALLFGCLISATDPVAVIALFKEVGVPKRLAVLVEGESVFNDATAIVTYQIILITITIGIFDARTVQEGLLDFGVVFFGGLLVGLAFGFLLVWAIPFVGEEPLVHITLTLVTAYGAFLVADHGLHVSGIMAVLAAGLVIGYNGQVLYSLRVRDNLHVGWEDLAFVANSLIFLMLGLSEQVFLSHVSGNLRGLLLPMLAVIAIVVVVRFALVFGLVPLLNALPRARPIDLRFRAVLAWNGLRGAIAVALALSLPSHFPYRWQIVDFTFGVTLFSLLAFGSTMAWLVRRLRLDRPSRLQAYLLAYAEVVAKREALASLRRREPDGSAEHASALGRVQQDYRETLRGAEAELAALRSEICVDAETRHKLLWLRAFTLERQVYADHFQRGLLSLSSYRALERRMNRRESEVGRGAPPRPFRRPLPALNRPWLQPESPLHHLFAHAPWLRGLRQRSWLRIHEQAVACVDVVRQVVAQRAHLAEFSEAEEADVRACLEAYRSFGGRVEDALARLHLESEAARGIVRERHVRREAADSERSAHSRLALTEGLSEVVFDNLEYELEVMG